MQANREKSSAAERDFEISKSEVHPLAPMRKLVFIGGSLYRYQSKYQQEWNRGL